MATDVATLFKSALALTPEERADLAHRLLQTLDDDAVAADQDEIDGAWREEIRSRIDDILNGKVQLVSAEESDARVRALLAELHG